MIDSLTTFNNIAMSLAVSSGILGGVLFLVRYVFQYFMDMVYRKLIVSVSISSNQSQELFCFMQQWLAAQSFVKKSRALSARLHKDQVYNEMGYGTMRAFYSDPSHIKRGNEPDPDEIVYVPSVGTHAFIYNNRRVWVTITEKQKSNAASSAGEPPAMNMVLQCRNTGYGDSSGKSTIEKLISESKELVKSRENGRVLVYMKGNRQNRPSLLQSLPGLSLNSVILPNGASKQLLDDAQRFLSSREWYERNGVPFRRGYLLHGPPGSGKSSLVHALATELKLNIYAVQCNGNHYGGMGIIRELNTAPNDCILLLEDIDCLFPSRTKKSDSESLLSGDDEVAPKNTSTTFSDLLNAIDGVLAYTGKIMIMTTNYAEKLDSALLRPGRVDVKIEVGAASHEQIREIFLKFHPHEEELAMVFADDVMSIDGEEVWYEVRTKWAEERAEKKARVRKRIALLENAKKKEMEKELASKQSDADDESNNENINIAVESTSVATKNDDKDDVEPELDISQIPPPPFRLVSMAECQKFLVEFRHSAQQAAEDAREYFLNLKRDDARIELNKLYRAFEKVQEKRRNDKSTMPKADKKKVTEKEDTNTAAIDKSDKSDTVADEKVVAADSTDSNAKKGTDLDDKTPQQDSKANASSSEDTSASATIEPASASSTTSPKEEQKVSSKKEHSKRKHKSKHSSRDIVVV